MIKLREQRYVVDKCDITWTTLYNKSLHFVVQHSNTSEVFKASDGWIWKVLERNGKVGINLHSEVNHMPPWE